MKKTKLKTLRKFANEESNTAKDYRERGFISQANDEKRHSKFFKGKLKIR